MPLRLVFAAALPDKALRFHAVFETCAQKKAEGEPGSSPFGEKGTVKA